MKAKRNSKKPGQRWTGAETRRLKALTRQDKTIKEIAKILGRSKTTVSEKRRELGIHTTLYRHWTPKEVQQLKVLVAEGETSVAIAEVIGRTKQSVDSKRSQLGIDTPSKLSVTNPLHVAELVKFRMAEWTLDRIAKVYGVTESYISILLCQNGYKGFKCQPPKPKNPYRYWCETEVSRLRRYLDKEMTYEEIHAKLPDRTLAAIKSKVKSLAKAPPAPLPFREDTRRSPQALNQEVRRTLMEFPNKPDTWHAHRNNTLEKTIQIIRSGISIGV